MTAKNLSPKGSQGAEKSSDDVLIASTKLADAEHEQGPTSSLCAEGLESVYIVYMEQLGRRSEPKRLTGA